MLIFVTTAKHAYTIADFLQGMPTPLTGRVITMSYGELLSWRRLPAGHYIFADVDRLDTEQRKDVSRRIEALRAALPDAQLLNHPLDSLGRLALLQRLHAEGLNDFRAQPALLGAAGLRFPVFVRTAVEHFGALSAPLATEGELDSTLASLAARGVKLDDCLIVEFIDVRAADGLYEKYSMQRVGKALFATDRSSNKGWICKGEESEESRDNWAEEDLRFQRDAPHRNQVLKVFELAGIDYGRIDYAFSQGRMQVFEINSNPAIRVPERVPSASRPSAELHKQHFIEALLPLTQALASRGMVEVAGATGIDTVEAPTRFRRSMRSLLRKLGCLQHEHTLIRLRNRLGPSRPQKPSTLHGMSEPTTR